MSVEPMLMAPSTVEWVPPKVETLREARLIARKLDEWMVRRDEIIVQAKSEGASLRELADIFGMSHQGISNLIERANQRASEVQP